MKKYLQVVLVSGEGMEYEWNNVEFCITSINSDTFFTVHELNYAKPGELLLCVPVTRLLYYGRIER